MCPVGGFGWRAPRILWGVKSIVEESRLLDFGFIRPQTAAGISLLILVHTTHSYRPCKVLKYQSGLSMAEFHSYFNSTTDKMEMLIYA